MTITKFKALGASVAMAGMLLSGGAAFAGSVTSNVILGSGVTNGDFTVDTGSYGDPNAFLDGLPVAELGLRAKLRFDENNAPQNVFNYDGVETYTFQAGLAPSGFGFAPGSTGTATWNFEWSIGSDRRNPGAPLPGQSSVNALTYELRIDGDASAAIDFLVFDPIALPFADHAFGTTATAQSGGVSATNPFDYALLANTSSLAQNSWNYEFFNTPGSALENFDARTAGTYRIELEAFSEGVSVASTGINVVVTAAVPLPAGLPLMLGGLGLLAFMRRRR